MPITSKGYAGTVNYVDWAVLSDKLGAQYAVFGADAFKVAPTAGDRAVSVQPGEASGQGIRDLSDSVAILTGAPVASGDRWDLVALRRDWAAKTTTLVVVPGTAVKGIPAAREKTIGQIVDHPLALVRFTAGQTTPQDVVDLRVWHGDGGIWARDLMVRDFLDRVGTVVSINRRTWARVLDATGLPTWISTDGGRLLGVYPLNWFGMAPSGSLPGQGISVWGNSTQTLAEFQLPDPGVPYRIQGYAAGHWGSEFPDRGNRFDFEFLVGDVAVARWVPPADGFDFRNWRSWATNPSLQTFSGAARIGFRARRIQGPAYGAVKEAESPLSVAVFSA